MSEFVELHEAPDESWTIYEKLENGLVRPYPLGKLTKEQAVREAQLRGFTHIRTWDKRVLKALAEGKVDMKRSRIE